MMDSRIKIVPIEEHHAEGFHACLDAVAKESGFLARNEAPPLESTKKFVQENIRTKQIQIVALHDDDVIGWVDVLGRSNGSENGDRYLGIGVLENWRGKGIGKILLTRVIDAVAKAGLQSVALTVDQSNKIAIEMYRKIGFEEQIGKLDPASNSEQGKALFMIWNANER